MAEARLSVSKRVRPSLPRKVCPSSKRRRRRHVATNAVNVRTVVVSEVKNSQRGCLRWRGQLPSVNSFASRGSDAEELEVRC
jgi:hypothetical protein